MEKVSSTGGDASPDEAGESTPVDGDVTGAIDYQRAETETEAVVPNGPAGRVDLAVIALRTLGAAMIVITLPDLIVKLVGLVGANESGIDAVTLMSPSGVYFAAGLVLWAISTRVARWMLSDVASDASNVVPRRGSHSSARIQALWLSLIGAAAVLHATRHLIDAVAWIAAGQRGDVAYDIGFEVRLCFISFAIEAGIGTAVFFGSRGLAGLWHRVRKGS